MWTADSFVQDVSAGAWVHEGLSLFADGHRGHLVGDVVPPVFEAYARILHPAYRRIGPAVGEVEHRGRGQPGLWDEGPLIGDLDGATARALIAVLASFTTTADRCWFAIWEGHSILDDVRDRAGRMQAGWMGCS